MDGTGNFNRRKCCIGIRNRLRWILFIRCCYRNIPHSVFIGDLDATITCIATSLEFAEFRLVVLVLVQLIDFLFAIIIRQYSPPEDDAATVITNRHLVEFQVGIGSVVDRDCWFAVGFHRTTAIQVVGIDRDVAATGDQFIRHLDIDDLVATKGRNLVFMAVVIFDSPHQAQISHLVFQHLPFLLVADIGRQLVVIRQVFPLIGLNQFAQITPTRCQDICIVHRTGLDLPFQVGHMLVFCIQDTDGILAFTRIALIASIDGCAFWNFQARNRDIDLALDTCLQEPAIFHLDEVVGITGVIGFALFDGEHLLIALGRGIQSCNP